MKIKQILIGALCVAVIGITGCSEKTKTCKIKSSLNNLNGGSVYFYDDDRLTEMKYYSSGGSLSDTYYFEYDVNGKIMKVKDYSYTGNLNLQNNISYNFANEITGIYNYSDSNNDGIGDLLTDYYTYTYASDGTIDQAKYYDNTNTLQYTATYTWTNGNITSIEYQPLNTEYVFEYDDHSNWRANLNEYKHISSYGFSEMSKNNMTKIEHYIGGVLNSTSTRTYTYNADGSVESDNGYYNTFECTEE